MTSHSNTVTVEIQEEVWVTLPPELRSMFTVVRVEPKDYDYSDDPKWVELNELSKESYKYYKLKKQREYEIRHSKDHKG